MEKLDGPGRLVAMGSKWDGPKSKSEWRETLHGAEATGAPVQIVYGHGIRNMRFRFWPPALVYDAPPRSLLGR